MDYYHGDVGSVSGNSYPFDVDGPDGEIYVGGNYGHADYLSPRQLDAYGFDLQGRVPNGLYRNERPLINGTGFTTRAILGLRVGVSDDIEAGAEFSSLGP